MVSPMVHESLQQAFRTDRFGALVLLIGGIGYALWTLLPNEVNQWPFTAEALVFASGGALWLLHIFNGYKGATDRYLNCRQQKGLASYCCDEPESLPFIRLICEDSGRELVVFHIQPTSETQMEHLKIGNVPVSFYRETDGNKITIASEKGLVFGVVLPPKE